MPKANGGYFIGRYEARTESKRNAETDTLMKLTEKQDDYVYNYVTQLQASKLSREMYSNSTFKSDLINSFAWDTAIIFLQEFGEENYSVKMPTVYSFSEKGTNTDKVCNVFDMANNLSEWSTEAYSNSESPYTHRGGYYYNSSWSGGRANFARP